MRIQDKQINNPTETADASNKYFITAAGKLKTTRKERKPLNFYMKAKMMIY